jgi:hypothetical protein
MPQKTFAIALMDAPYESENLTTAFGSSMSWLDEDTTSTCSPTKGLGSP